MYEEIKIAFGPQISKFAPIRSSSGETLKDRGKQMERWVEHFQELYSRDFKISDQLIQNIQSLSIINKLDSLPALRELSKAIDSLACAKASDNDASSLRY